MSTPVFAKELSPSAFEIAQSAFKAKEAANWVEAQIRSELSAIKAICKVFYLDFDEDDLTVTFQSDSFHEDCKNLLGGVVQETEYHRNFLLYRSQIFTPVTSEVIGEFFPDCHEVDVLAFIPLVMTHISDNRPTLSKQTFDEIGSMYMDKYKEIKAQYEENTESAQWFTELSEDWGMTYFEDGSIAEDPAND